MANEDEKTFVNTPMEPDLVEKLDEMVEEYESSRAQFIRLLVKQRYEEFRHVKGIGDRVKPKIKQVARS
jgi:metal-responsive CopG/Arc/MetJ family transcriptional regulator